MLTTSTKELRKLGKIEVKLTNGSYVIDPGVLLHVDYLRIRDSLMEYGGNYAWVGSIYEAVAKRLRAEEDELERIGAEVDAEFRRKEKAAHSSERKFEIKEKTCSNAVILSPEYQEQKQLVAYWMYLKRRIGLVVDAMDKHGQMLIQLAGIAKKELSAEG